MTATLDPGWQGVALAGVLFLGALVGAHLGGVRLWRQGLVAGARATLQLVAVGLSLGYVFALDHPAAIVGVLVLMLGVAAWTAAGRIGPQLGRLAPALAVVLGVVTGFALLYVTHLVLLQPRLTPRYAIPLAGIALGNAMTAANLAGSHYVARLAERKPTIETALSLGASPAQADRDVFRGAVLTALTPVLNAMLIVGIVKLPGIMSGQMLGGSSPLIAAKYQLVVLFMLAFGDGITALWTLRVLRRRAFNQAWQLTL